MYVEKQPKGAIIYHFQEKERERKNQHRKYKVLFVVYMKLSRALKPFGCTLYCIYLYTSAHFQMNRTFTMIPTPLK